MRNIIPVFFCGLLLATSASAEVAYVNDELLIMMRTGESTQHQIMRSLKSGTRLEVLERNKDSGYSRVRLSDGTEGWVLHQYLTSIPIARHRLVEAEKKIAELENKLSSTANELKQTSSDRQQLDKTSSQLNSENQKLKKELAEITAISRNAIALNDDNKAMHEKIIRLETDLQAMEQQNAVLKDRGNRDWFITGAGVTILGIIIGLLVPKLRLQRKAKWNEL